MCPIRRCSRRVWFRSDRDPGARALPGRCGWARSVVTVEGSAERIMRRLRQLWDDEGGATAVEYALLLAAIAAVIIVVVFAVGKHTKKHFEDYESALP